MKKYNIYFIAIIISFGLFSQAHAALQNLGTDNLGNSLIYDTDLNITWYDYSRNPDTWPNQLDWAEELSVTFGSNTYSDWRLPTTADGLYVFGYDGTTTAGYNITSSEMGHLFYTELGNIGAYDTSGNPTSCAGNDSPYCLNNTSYFQNLQPDFYWSGTRYLATSEAWGFVFSQGFKEFDSQSNGNYAIAVRSGRAIAPEPISSILFITGGTFFAVRTVRKSVRRGVDLR